MCSLRDHVRGHASKRGRRGDCFEGCHCLVLCSCKEADAKQMGGSLLIHRKRGLNVGVATVSRWVWGGEGLLA